MLAEVEVAEEGCVHLPFEAGDIQLVNNHCCFHGRTAYEDDPSSPNGKRSLLRLWLQLDEPRPLAAGAFELRARGIRADSDGAAEHRDITVGQKL